MRKQFLALALISTLAYPSASAKVEYTTSTQTKILSGLCFAVPAAITAGILYHNPTQEVADKLLFYGIGAAFIGLAGWAGYTIVNWFTPEGRFATASDYVEEIRKDYFIQAVKRDGGQTNIIAHVENVWVNFEFPLADAFETLRTYRGNILIAKKLFKKVLTSDITEHMRQLSEGYLRAIPSLLVIIENSMKEVKNAPNYLHQVKAKNAKLARIAQQRAASAAWHHAISSSFPQDHNHYVYINRNN